jgi:FkbM family methyltransferase
MILLRTLSYICRHPLNKDRKVTALRRYLNWQIGSRLVPGSVAVPFVDETRLLIEAGMHGATGNLYCGLHEFQDMGFVLHALRPGDLFVDIGANIGSYTILAAGACDAYVVAVEPIPATFEHLLDNVRLNGLSTLVTTKNVAVGATAGRVVFSDGLDTGNHVLAEDEVHSVSGILVPVETLDTLLEECSPTILKIDVEGYEACVLQGAKRALESENLLGVIVELNGSGARYGTDDTSVHSSLLARGFSPVSYEPFGRNLTSLRSKNEKSGNTIYVRELELLQARVKASPPHTVGGVTL